MVRQEIKTYMHKNKNQMAYNHLECWFTKKFQGEDKEECKRLLNEEYDHSVLFEELEEKFAIKLTNQEEKYAKNRFIEAVLASIYFGGASLYIDLYTNKEYKKSIN